MIQDTQRTDSRLLAAWVELGDAEALEILVFRYAPLVHSVCKRQCRSTVDAEDAFQVTFMILARSAESIRSAVALPAWLHATAYRVSMRTRRPMQQTDSGNLAECKAVTTESNPLDAIARQHELCVLDEELNQLPEKTRTPLVLHYLQGQQLSEVAEQLGTTLGAIRGRLQRGRNELRQRLLLRGVSLSAAITTLQMQTTAPSAQAAEWANTVAMRLASESQVYVPQPTPHSSVTSSNFSYSKGLAMKSSLIAAALTLPLAIAGNPFGTRDDSAGIVGQQSHVLVGALATTEANEAQIGGLRNSPVTDDGGGTSDVATPSDPQQQDDFEEIADFNEQLSQILSRPLKHSLGTMPLNKLGASFAALGIPVVIDLHGADLKLPENASITLEDGEIPLSAALKQALRPLGLLAEVRDEAVMITPDTVALARKGIGTSKYVNVDDKFMKQLTEMLANPISIDANSVPLIDVVRMIQERLELQITVDQRALEELGLDGDAPVSISLEEVSAYDVLQAIADATDLALLPANGYLKFTTTDKCESPQHLLRRIYWLDGTGLSPGVANSVLTESISQENWSEMGGTNTIAALQSELGRPTLIVTASYAVHREIESLFDSIRSNTVNPDASYEWPAYNQGGGYGGGMGGMGGGGMGGMGGGGMF